MKSKLNIKSILIVAIIGIMSFVFLNKSFAANTATVNVETANIRKSADANSTIVEQASKGQEVEIIESEGDWYKVKYNNIQGYVRKDLVEVEGEVATEKANTEKEENETKQEEVADNKKVEETTKTPTENTEQEQITTGMYTCKENTKLRIIPLIFGKEIKEINKDATVNVLEINNKWALVESGTNRGWVLVSDIEKVKEDSKENESESESEKEEVKEENSEENNQEEKEEEKQEETAAQEVPKNATMYVNSEVVNLREEPTITSQSIGRITKAAEVQVTAEISGWSKVKVNNQEGYILSTLLSDRKPETTTSRSLEEERQSKEETKTETNTKTESTTQETTTETSSNKGQEVCNYAKQFLGCKYVYGGTSPNGFDCSGFTQYVYKHFGVTLNRTAEAQASNGTAVSKSQLKAGDLVIFTHHVGIYLGNGTFIHAANSQKGVITTSLSDSYYVKNYITARRIF